MNAVSSRRIRSLLIERPLQQKEDACPDPPGILT